MTVVFPEELARGISFFLSEDSEEVSDDNNAGDLSQKRTTDSEQNLVQSSSA